MEIRSKEGKMKAIGSLVILLGIILGIGIAGGVGMYLMLYGGILGAIEACKGGIDSAALTFNIIRALFWEFGVVAGVLVGAPTVIIGMVIFEDDSKGKP